MMKKSLLATISFLLILLSLSSKAQQPNGQRMEGSGRMSKEGGFGTLKGTIVDEATNLPIEYANIVIFKMRDSSMVTGGITDTKGNFTIEKVPFGKYYVEFKFIGYKNNKVDGVMVTPKQAEVSIGTIKLKSASENLEGVVVTGQKSMLQSNLDKKVINVDRNISAEGGTALDIMRSIPSVDVDVQGNVSLRGSSNLTILVDGKPSQIQSLDELPASIVQSVEVITNPSVRYDPDGMSGILNIVLKKKKTPGYHGMISLNAGTGNKYSGTANINVRQGKFNFFGNFDYRHFASTGRDINDSYYEYNNSLKNQYGDDERTGLSNNFRGGIDYFINDKNSLTLSGSINVRNFDGIEKVKDYKTLNSNYYFFNSQNNDETNKMTGNEIALNYKKTFNKQGQEFTVDALYSKYNRNSDSYISRLDSASVLEKDKSFTDGKNNSFTVETNLVNPIGNGGRLESGLKAIIRNQDADYIYLNYLSATDVWQDTSNTSNRYTFDDQIYAGYLIYSNTIGAISYQGGIRAEDQIKKIDQRTQNKTVNTSLFNLFPSAHVKWDINKTNAVKVSYSKRVNRPSGRVLNPFVDREDKYNISYGNPYLKPEYTDSYELGHSLNLEKTNINSTLFYRRTTNKITQITILDGATFVSSYTNLASGSTLGLEVVASQNFTKWLRANGSISLFKAKLDEYSYMYKGKDTTFNANESNSWTAKINTSFTITKNLEFQLNGNYRSPVITGVSTGGDRGYGGGGGNAQGKTKELYWLDLGLRYSFLSNKASLTLRVSDIFNTRRFKSTTYGIGYSSYSEMRQESQIVFLGFSYKINDYKQRRDSKIDEMSSDMDNQ